MNDPGKFEGFKNALIEENEHHYGEEVRAQYGSKVVDRTNERIRSLTPEQYEGWKKLEQDVLNDLEQAVLNQDTPDSAVGKQLTDLHRQWLSYTWNSYSPAAHKGLAQMYVCDERFTAYYDRNVPGCALFLRDAIITHA